MTRNGFGDFSAGVWYVKVFSGSFVELPGDGAELSLHEGREIDAVGQVLARQTIGVLVGNALPRAVRIAENSNSNGRG